MSGHSKWASIKHQKAVTDARRGQLFTKLTREIIVAVKKGGPNSDVNFSLRLAIQKARDNSMPSDNIERAIKRGSGAAEGANFVEMVLEGYGPSGGAILVQALSDNRNRTVQNIRNLFSRGGGNMGESGCVGWLFNSRGVIRIKIDNLDADELTLQAIDAGAEDVAEEDDFVTVYTQPTDLMSIRTMFEQAGIAIESVELAMVPKTIIDLDEKPALQTLRLMDKLEELEDVRTVSTNVNFTDSVLEMYQQ